MGCPTECLPVLAGIPPPNLRRVELTPKFVNKVVASKHHPLHSRISSALPHSLYPRKFFTQATAPLPTTFHPSCSTITWYTTVQHHGILDEHLELCAFPPCQIWFVTCKQTPPRIRSLPQGVVYPESSSNRSRTFQLLLI